jgi:tetratricopeptide (TPR) repeat protein
MLQEQIQTSESKLSFSKVQRYLFWGLLFLLPLAIFPFPWDWTERSMSILILTISTLIVAVELLKIIWDGKTNILKSALDVGLFLLLFSMLLSSLFSLDLNTSLWGIDGRLGNGLIVFISIILVTITARTFINTEEELKYTIFAFLGGFFVNNILSILSFFGVNIWEIIPVYRALHSPGLPLLRSSGVQILLSFVNLILCINLIGEYLIKKEKESQLIISSVFGVLSIFSILLFSLNQGVFVVILSLVVLMLFSIFLIGRVRLEKGTQREILIFCLVTAAIILIPFSLLQVPSIRGNFVSEDFNLLTEINLGNQISWIVSSSVLVTSFARAVIGLGVDTFSIAYNLHRPMDIGLLAFNDITFYKAGSEVLTQLTNNGLLWLLIWFFFGYLIGKSFIVDLKSIKLSKDVVNNWRLLTVNTAIVLIYLSSFFVTYSVLVLFVLLFLIAMKSVIKNLLDKDNDERFVVKFWAVDMGARDKMKQYASNLSILLSIVVVLLFGALTTLWFSKAIASINTLRAEAYLINESMKYVEVEPTRDERSVLIETLIGLRSNAVNFDKNNPQYIRRLALMYAEVLVLNVEDYSEILEQSGGEPDEQENEAMISNIMFWRNSALELSKKSIEKAPFVYANRDVNSRIHILLVDLGVSDQDSEVMASIERALDLNPINYNLHYSRAQIFLTREDMQSSLESLSDVLTINPYHVPSIILFANINREMGNMDVYESYLKAAKRILEDEGLTELEIYGEIATELNSLSMEREASGGALEEPEPIELPEYDEEDPIDLGLDNQQDLGLSEGYIVE